MNLFSYKIHNGMALLKIDATHSDISAIIRGFTSVLLKLTAIRYSNCAGAYQMYGKNLLLHCVSEILLPSTGNTDTALQWNAKINGWY